MLIPNTAAAAGEGAAGIGWALPFAGLLLLIALMPLLAERLWHKRMA